MTAFIQSKFALTTCKILVAVDVGYRKRDARATDVTTPNTECKGRNAQLCVGTLRPLALYRHSAH